MMPSFAAGDAQNHGTYSLGHSFSTSIFYKYASPIIILLSTGSIYHETVPSS